MKGIRIDAKGPTLWGATLTTEDNRPIHGVRAVTVHMELGKPLVANLELVGAKLTAEIAAVRLFMRDPFSGEMKQIRRVEFADGSSFTDSAA